MKNSPIRRFDSSDPASRRNASVSSASASASGSSDPRTRQSIASRTAFGSLGTAGLNRRSASGTGFRFHARMCAGAVVLTVPTAAASSSADGSTSRTSPSDFASSALTVRPVASRSAAGSSPSTRGSRCVPPHPGISPSFTSGSPSSTRGLVPAIR